MLPSNAFVTLEGNDEERKIGSNQAGGQTGSNGKWVVDGDFSDVPLVETNGLSVCNQELQSNHKHCSTIWDPNGVQMTLLIIKLLQG